MKCLSILQPWGLPNCNWGQEIETRSWQREYRGPLAIHASKGREWWKIAHDEPFRSVLLEAGLYRQDDLPYGAVIATCNMVNCLLIQVDGLYSRLNNRKVCDLPPEPERSFGDYTPGRYAWILEDTKSLPEPIPVKGHQGLWNWESPEGLL